MDPSQNNNQGAPAGWNPFMYTMQCPSGTWFPQGLQQQVPNAPMMAGMPNVPLMQPTGMGAMFPRPGFFPANVATPVPDEAEVEVANPTYDVMSPSNNSSGPKKLPNFSPDEDCWLVKSWLEISCDPVVGNGQKLDRMWARIKERYDLRAYQPRSMRSLQSRQSIIKKEVEKFAGFYADAVRENPSGMSDADKKFQFLHCWDIMKDEAKWRDAADPSELIDQGVGDDIGQDDNCVQVEGAKSTEESMQKYRGIQ